MCNLSEVVEERGIKKGMEQGIEQGIERGLAQGIEQGKEQGIRGLVDILNEMGTSKDVIVDKIMEKFLLTEEQARKFVE